MRARELVVSLRDRVSGAGLQCADPLLHAKQLVQLALGWDSTRIYIEWERELTVEEIAQVEAVAARRLQGEPYQYIAGEEGFWTGTFKVGPGVLIPRRETELLVEAALRKIPAGRCRVGELGAGSGNIGISCLLERREWEWHAYELNPKSLSYARVNAEALLFAGAKYHLHDGNFFDLAGAQAPFDALVANPPYVASSQMSALSKEVRQEPTLALDGGVEGLEILEKLVDIAPKLLVKGGWLMCEIGSPQGDAVKQMFGKSLVEVDVLRDYSGLPRIAYGRTRN